MLTAASVVAQHVFSDLHLCREHSCVSGCVGWLSGSLKPGVLQKPGQSWVDVHITSLSGDELCSLRIQGHCTVEELKCDIQLETQIPWMRQHLIHGDAVAPLDNASCIGDLADAAQKLELKMIQVQKPESEQTCLQYVDPTALVEAIRRCDTEKCEELLSLKVLPGLNDKDIGKSTVLHHAAWHGLAGVCQIILERPDFTEADAQEASGLTALHYACHRGHVGVARTLLMSNSFTDIDSNDGNLDRTGLGWSARDVAEQCGHDMIVLAIDTAIRK